MNILIFQNRYEFFQVFFPILRKERNITRFGYVFVTTVTHKNFSGNWTNSCTIIASIFFENGIFMNVKKNEENRMDSRKSINSFEMKKDSLPV